MPKPALAESLLALFAGPDRAAAIYGDLTEMAATRGSLWFLAAYARTIVSLARRPFAAFLAGAVVSAALLYAQLPIALGHIFLAISHPRIWPPLDVVTSTLWFLAPFAVVLYGIRDKAAQLAVAMLVAMSAPFYLGLWFNFDPIAAECIALGLLVAACAVSTPWRASLLPLAGVYAMGFATSKSLAHVKWIADLDYRDPAMWALVLVDMVAMSIIFCWLHAWARRRFHHSQSTGVAHA